MAYLNGTYRDRADFIERVRSTIENATQGKMESHSWTIQGRHAIFEVADGILTVQQRNSFGNYGVASVFDLATGEILRESGEAGDRFITTAVRDALALD